MKRVLPRLLVVVLAIGMVPSGAFPQKRAKQRTPAAATPRRTNAGSAIAPHLKIAGDLERRLAEYKRVSMPFNAAALTARERRLVEKLVAAAQYLEEIYWRQSDPEALTLYEQLAGSANPRDRQLRQFLFINAGRFDLLDDNKPFVGDEPMPAGRGFYPQGLTREQIEQYVVAHPEKKADIYSPYTVIRRQGDELIGIPYHIAYRSFLEPAAQALRAAAALSADRSCAAFLRARAQALLTDDYFPSDLKWLDLKDPRFDVIFAPYEVYSDGILGVKTTYGAAVLIRNAAESKKLAVFQKYVPEIQNALPLPPADRPSLAGHQTPMEVMDSPFRAGDLNHGYQAVADNLPNDPRIHEEKGSKKIFFKNFMDARVRYLIVPLAKKLMRADQAQKATAEGYLTDTLAHEIAHGLGPAFARTASGKVTIQEALGPLYSGLEEAKADVVGLFLLQWLMDRGVLPEVRLQEAYAAHVADFFRTLRFGIAEAHARAAMMEFNYFAEQKAITRDSISGRYVVDYAGMPGVVAALAKELLEIEASGDRARGEQWFARYEKMPPELAAALKAAAGVPVDISPVFAFPERVQ
jgi:hypothetical protein